MKVDRLLGIVTVLLNNDKTKAKDLSEKFEVSIRTIYRDIENICKAGIPIITYQGGDGGISIAKEYKLDKSALTIDELDNILIGLKSIESISQDTNIKLLLEKLTPKQESIISVNNNIFIDLTSFQQISLPQKINVLRKSVKERKEVFFHYYSAKGTFERYIEPYFIIFKWSSWYVFAFCKLRQDFRLFKLTRMVDLKSTDTVFNIRNIPKEKIQLDSFFHDEQIVTMVIDRCLEYQLIDNFGADCYEIIENNLIKIDLPYTNYEFVIQLILSFGDKVEVLSPTHIIDDLRIHAQNILNRYK